MKGYKGFEPGLICRGKQYAGNTVFEEESAEICSSGMHFCENPFDVLDHYPLINDKCEINEFAEVEALDEAKTDDGKKFCTKKLKVGAKLGLDGFINACVEFLFEKSDFDKMKNDAEAAASGCESKLAASGDASNLAASGYASNLAASGYASKLAASGDASIVECSGTDSVICCAGHGSRAKAKAGCWITLAEWAYDCEKDYSIPICVKTEFVDGERIKEDVFYRLKNGEFVEVE
jgi:hypothetical protein